MLRVILMLGLLLGAQGTLAATYYIDDNGSDSNAGTSSGAPWRTWTKAFSSSACGDTLTVMDGTYTISHGAPVITKVCTASTPYTIIAQNERAAFIDGSPGTFVPFYVNGGAYITISGLRMRSGDKTPSSGGVNLGVINAYNSNHITIKRGIFSDPNRYRNAGHVIQLYNTFDSLIEENEVYNFHRHGIYIGGGSSRNVIRRNYCDGRGKADLVGSEVENPVDGPSEAHADDCFIVYPGSDNIFENNIANGDMLKCIAVEAIGTANNNKFLGNICMGGAWNGVALDARGSTAGTMPQNTTIQDQVVLDTQLINGSSSYRFNGNKNTVCRNCTSIGGLYGFSYDRLTAQPGDGIYSGSLLNSLAIDATTVLVGGSPQFGWGIRFSSAVQTWSAVNSNAYNNVTNYSPSSSANYSPANPPTTTDPGMGTCKVWRPDGSYAKLNNQGTDILYRYENGVLTNTPLWDTTTGEFPFGAIVVGVNDVAGSSPFDVHTRLNVNSGGCSFPSGFGSEPTPETTLTQARFRIEEFNGPEANPNLKAAENTNYTVQVGGCARIRFKITADASVSAGPRGFAVWVAANGGSYAALTDDYVSKVKFSGLGNDSVSETVTTEQMTDDEANYSPGPIVRSSTQTIQIDMGPNYDTELIALVCIQDTAVPDTDYWDFRIRQVDPTTSTVSDLDAYNATARLTTKRRAAGAI